MRFYNAICACLEAFTEYLRTDTLEREFETVDWDNGDD